MNITQCSYYLDQLAICRRRLEIQVQNGSTEEKNFFSKKLTDLTNDYRRVRNALFQYLKILLENENLPLIERLTPARSPQLDAKYLLMKFRIHLN